MDTGSKKTGLAEALAELKKAEQAAAQADQRVAKAKTALKKLRSEVAIVLGEWVIEALKAKDKNDTLNDLLFALFSTHDLNEKRREKVLPWLEAQKITLPAKRTTTQQTQTQAKPQPQPQATKPQAITPINNPTAPTTTRTTLENRPIPGARQ